LTPIRSQKSWPRKAAIAITLCGLSESGPDRKAVAIAIRKRGLVGSGDRAGAGVRWWTGACADRQGAGPVCDAVTGDLGAVAWADGTIQLEDAAALEGRGVEGENIVLVKSRYRLPQWIFRIVADLVWQIGAERQVLIGAVPDFHLPRPGLAEPSSAAVESDVAPDRIRESDGVGESMFGCIYA
jgi:hypothetical protein